MTSKKNFVYVIYTDCDTSDMCEVTRIYARREDAEQYLLNHDWHLNEEYGWYEHPDIDWCVRSIIKKRVR